MVASPSRLILASSSPARLALLNQAGMTVDQTFSPNINETLYKGELPTHAILRITAAKMAVAREQFPHDFIITADTMIICRRQVFDKTMDPVVAKKYWQTFSGRRVTALTAVNVGSPQGKTSVRLVKCVLNFKRLTTDEIEFYLKNSEWQNSAGALSYMAERFIKRINGSYSACLGLPLYETTSLLQGLGFPL